MDFSFLSFFFFLLVSIELFSCSQPLTRSSGKRQVDTLDSVGDDELFSDQEDDVADSLEIIFIYDQMFPDSYYENISDQLTSLFDELNSKGYFSDFIYSSQEKSAIERQDEKIKTTDKFKNSLLCIDELTKPFPKLYKKIKSKILRPVQVLPQMTLQNLKETFASKDAANFLTRLSSVGPYYSSSILLYLQDPSTPDLADFFAGTEVKEPATQVPLHYLKKKELELFHAFLLKYKFKADDFYARKLFELIQVCLYDIETAQTAYDAFETIFKTQHHVIEGFESSLFKLLLEQEAFLTLRLYFKLAPSPKKSSTLFSIVVNSDESVIKQDIFDLYLLTMPELDVNSLVKIRSDHYSYMAPVILGFLYIKHRFLVHSLLLHPEIDLNRDFEFIHLKPSTIPDFKWPNLPLHLHALLLFEFQKSWEIAFHPLYRRSKMELKYLFDILFIIYTVILMKFKLK